jgi:hypothetical protein
MASSAGIIARARQRRGNSYASVYQTRSLAPIAAVEYLKAGPSLAVNYGIGMAIA